MRKSFETLYRSVSGPLKKFIAKRTGADEQAIDEIYSQTMTAAWKSYTTFEHKSSYFTWICRIALNKIADYYRSQVHAHSQFIAPLLEDLVEPDALSLEEELVLNELKKAINRCLNLLPEHTRRILHLRYWEDASIREIARILRITPKAAEDKLYRARKAFEKVYNYPLCKQ